MIPKHPSNLKTRAEIIDWVKSEEAMTYIPPERTPRKRGPQESREEYTIYYDNFWAEREANPIPPPPPAPDRPTRDSSRKSWPPPAPPQPPQGPYANASRKQPKAIYLDHLYTQDEIDEMEYNAIHRRVFRLVLRFIDWLNRLAGAGKPKEKTNGERMTSLCDLFEGYEDEEDIFYTEPPPTPPPPPAPSRPTRDATRRY